MCHPLSPPRSSKRELDVRQGFSRFLRRLGLEGAFEGQFEKTAPNVDRSKPDCFPFLVPCSLHLGTVLVQSNQCTTREDGTDGVWDLRGDHPCNQTCELPKERCRTYMEEEVCCPPKHVDTRPVAGGGSIQEAFSMCY